MPFCSKCGKEVKEGENFCPSCGHSLKEDVKIPSDKVLEIKIEDVKRRIDLYEKSGGRNFIGGTVLIAFGYILRIILRDIHHLVGIPRSMGLVAIIFGILCIIVGLISIVHASHLREKLKKGEIG